MFCTNCGNKLDDDAIFCQNCGKKVSDDSKLICGHCGAELEKDAVFCTKCGNKILKNEETKPDSSSEERAPESPQEESPADNNFGTEKAQEQGISIEKADFDNSENKTPEPQNSTQEEQMLLQQEEQSGFENSKEEPAKLKRGLIVAIIFIALIYKVLEYVAE